MPETTDTASTILRLDGNDVIYVRELARKLALSEVDVYRLALDATDRIRALENPVWGYTTTTTTSELEFFDRREVSTPHPSANNYREIALPDDVAVRVDAMARETGLTREALLVNVITHLQRLTGWGDSPQVAIEFGPPDARVRKSIREIVPEIAQGKQRYLDSPDYDFLPYYVRPSWGSWLFGGSPERPRPEMYDRFIAKVLNGQIPVGQTCFQKELFTALEVTTPEERDLVRQALAFLICDEIVGHASPRYVVERVSPERRVHKPSELPRYIMVDTCQELIKERDPKLTSLADELEQIADQASQAQSANDVVQAQYDFYRAVARCGDYGDARGVFRIDCIRMKVSRVGTRFSVSERLQLSSELFAISQALRSKNVQRLSSAVNRHCIAAERRYAQQIRELNEPEFAWPGPGMGGGRR